MRFTVTDNCFPNPVDCIRHFPTTMVQIFSLNRDDPIIVQQFDMRIKNGKKEEDDLLQLIEGIIELYDLLHGIELPIFRISGDCGAVDISYGRVILGVEATVEIAILEVISGFDLSLSCDLFMPEQRGDFQLFCGIIGQSCDLRRFIEVIFEGKSCSEMRCGGLHQALAKRLAKTAQ
uniref:DUF6598 domain-containing protein n=1 Tax=Oryza punctata TaxID=4537 RepID=A0A0E0MCP2_ORYPU